jgi:hypothetical protein
VKRVVGSSSLSLVEFNWTIVCDTIVPFLITICSWNSSDQKN